MNVYKTEERYILTNLPNEKCLQALKIQGFKKNSIRYNL